MAVETSGRVGSIALRAGRAALGERVFEHGLKNAATILPAIDDLVRPHGGPGAIATLCVSVGPGSFTGLRIATTLAKTLAFATGCRIVAVPSLPVLARNAPDDATHVIIVLDAKRGQIFTARYERDGEDWIEREPARLDTLAAMLARAPRPVHLIGEGIDYHRSVIPSHPDIIVTDPTRWRARAEVVADLGLRMATAGKFADPMRLAPLYIRLPEAEEKRLVAEGKIPPVV